MYAIIAPAEKEAVRKRLSFTDIREKPDIIRKMATGRHIHRSRLKRSMRNPV